MTIPTDEILEAWGQANPDQVALPNGAPNPFYGGNDAIKKTHGETPVAPVYIPNFGQRLDSSQPNGAANADPNRDPNPKRHGSLPVVRPIPTVTIA